jgi:hypothetical protein
MNLYKNFYFEGQVIGLINKVKIHVQRFIAKLIGDYDIISEDYCIYCKHYIKKAKCKAFPMGIPDELWSGKVLHLDNPYPGDNGYELEFKR